MSGMSPSKLPLCMGCVPPSNTWFLGSMRLSIPNDISIGSAVFAHMSTECPYTLQWGNLPPSKFPLPMGGSCSLGPRESSTQRASRSVQPLCYFLESRSICLYADCPMLLRSHHNDQHHLLDVVADFSTGLNEHDAQLFRLLLSVFKRNLSVQNILHISLCHV